MGNLTYVSLVPKESTDKLRKILSEEDTGEIEWREVRAGRGSEFYFTGPSALARCTHEYVTLWVANERLARSVGKTAALPANPPWQTTFARKAAAAAALIVFSVVVFKGSGALG
jgi:hypothetical protein